MAAVTVVAAAAAAAAGDEQYQDSFEPLAGVHGGSYQPSADDIGARVSAQVFDVRNPAVCRFAEVGPLIPDGKLVSATEAALHEGRLELPQMTLRVASTLLVLSFLDVLFDVCVLGVWRRHRRMASMGVALSAIPSPPPPLPPPPPPPRRSLPRLGTAALLLSKASTQTVAATASLSPTGRRRQRERERFRRLRRRRRPFVRCQCGGGGVGGGSAAARFARSVAGAHAHEPHPHGLRQRHAARPRRLPGRNPTGGATKAALVLRVLRFLIVDSSGGGRFCRLGCRPLFLLLLFFLRVLGCSSGALLGGVAPSQPTRVDIVLSSARAVRDCVGWVGDPGGELWAATGQLQREANEAAAQHGAGQHAAAVAAAVNGLTPDRPRSSNNNNSNGASGNGAGAGQPSRRCQGWGCRSR